MCLICLPRVIRTRHGVGRDVIVLRAQGITPNLMRVVPSSCITFVVYENVAKMLNART